MIKNGKQFDVDKFREFINGGYLIEDKPINTKNRKRDIVYARTVCFEFLFNLNYSLEKIGKFFDQSGTRGYIDHATVISGLRNFNNMIDKPRMYPEFHDIYSKINPILQTFIPTEEKKIDLSVIPELERKIIECKTWSDFLCIQSEVVIKNQIYVNN